MTRQRSGFTAIELATVMSIMAILLSTGAIASIPAIRRAAFSNAVAKLEDVAQQARSLAMASRTQAETYGVVIRNDQGRLVAAVTYGTSAGVGTIATRSNGEPLLQREIGQFQFFRGTSHAAATAMPDGGAVSWMYAPSTGTLIQDLTPSLRPYFAGVSAADLTAAGITDGATLIAPALSIRSVDGRRSMAVAVYATGIISSCPLAGR